MRRRTFLSTVGMAALAGCSNGDSESTATSTSTPTTTPTDSGESEFAFRGVEAPDTVALNTPTRFTVGVENVGAGRGTFTSVLETRLGDGEWTEGGTVEMSLAAGETGRWRSPEIVPRYLTTYGFRLVAFDETWSIETGPERLGFGEDYATPTGLLIAVTGGSFESAYTGWDDGTATPDPVTPTDGDQWLVLEVNVRNRLQEPRPVPPASAFTVEVGGERRPQHQEISTRPYEDGELDGRAGRIGELIYSVPSGTEVGDLTVSLATSFPGGDGKAIWRQG
jgi:hypothetical protein